MKNPLLYLVTLALAFFIISASSCHKEEPEPDLVPITTTGANTMGFYVDGVPYNMKGKYGGFTPQGVSGGIYENKILEIFGGGTPNISFTIDILIDPNKPINTYILNDNDPFKNRVRVIYDADLGGDFYYCDSTHFGFINLLRLEHNMAAGTFYFDAINYETGKVIHVTDGRFDIKFF